MSLLFPQDLNSYLQIMCVFLRLLGLFLVAPLFSHKAIPVSVKLFTAMALSLALFPIVRPSLPRIPETLSSMITFSIGESVIGFLMGFVALLTTEAIQLGAQFVGYQLGFGTVGLMDPQNQASVSAWVPLHGWLVLMAFLALDMHHALLSLFVKSYTVVQHAGEGGVVGSYPLILKLSGRLFFIAVQMAAPFTLLVMAVNGALGVLSRVLPQMNLLLFAFPITIFVGMAALYILTPELLGYIENLLQEMAVDIGNLIKVW